MIRLMWPVAKATCVTAALLSASAASAAETLQAVGHIPKSSLAMSQARDWVRDVNENLKRVRIDFAGGPEIVPRDGLIVALRGGKIAVGITDSADYRDEIAEIRVLALSRREPAQERKGGLYELLVAAHRRIQLRYIGRVRYAPFYLWTRRKVTGIAQLKGMKIRASGSYTAFMRKLGMAPVEISPRRTYQALKVGRVDGFGWSTVGPRARGWLRRVRYRIDLPLYRAENVVSLMNLTRWNKLKWARRQEIIAATARFENRMVARMANRIRAEEAALTRYGINRVRFSKSESRKYRAAAYEAEWSAIARRVPKKTLARLRKLSGN